MTFTEYEPGVWNHLFMIGVVVGALGIIAGIAFIYFTMTHSTETYGLYITIGSLVVFMLSLIAKDMTDNTIMVEDTAIVTDQSYTSVVKQGLDAADHITKVSDSFYSTDDGSFSVDQCELTITNSQGMQRDVGVVCLLDNGTTVETT